MNVLGSLIIAFSMYSRIPMPRIQWTQERMRYVMCFFPLIGVVMGIALYIAEMILRSRQMPYIVCGTVLPLLITGGIHMDGYLDVVDARSSYGEKEKKLEILKDPHVGAFAIIGCSVYLLLYLAAFSQMPFAGIPAMGAVYVLTRALSGLAVVTFPKAKKSGLAASFSDGAQKRAVVAAMAVYVVCSLGFLFWYAGVRTGIGSLAAAALVFYYYYHMAMKEFGGITGDVAGYFLQVAEFVLLVVLVVTI